MANTVYAESMGFFHKGSGGKGVAPGDVCLTPPPPPGGPMPVPYVNMLQASDLAKGSKTVKIEGEPTALENASHVSTSTGNEAGTQGGGVVTHKTKGKGSFKLWSFVVKAEGKGVCRHGDPMEQNTSSPLPNTIDASALVNFRVGLKSREKTKCKDDYKSSEHYTKTTRGQKRKVQKKACWECSRDLQRMRMRKNPPTKHIERLERRIQRQIKGHKPETPMIADHQPTQKAAWYAGGCNLKPSPLAFKNAMRQLYVKPHCRKHSDSQPGRQSKVDNRAVWKFMKGKGI